MRKQLLGAFAVGAIAALTLSACGSSSSGGDTGASAAAGGKIGVILPDTQSSARWENSDRPAFEKAFTDAGFTPDVQNAQNDTAKFATIADAMIAEKVKVLVITSLDSDSGNAVIKKATAVGIPVIDYDRPNLGGGAKYYVSFDNTKVGTTIGEGLVSCLKADGKTSGGIVELNGSPTDNNATLFKAGYDKVIKDAGYSVVADQAVPGWDNTKAGTIFDQIFTKSKGKFVGVAAANDGLGGAVVATLKRNGLAGKIPVSGQDATDEGLQRILLGTQCNSVFKPASQEVVAASKLAISLAKGDVAGADALATGTFEDTTAKTTKKAILLDPIGITKDNVKDVITGGGTTADKVCTTAALKKACTAAGVS